MDCFEGWFVFVTDQIRYVQFFVPTEGLPSAASAEFEDGLDWFPPAAQASLFAELRKEVLN
jgi:hypothetical protein